MSNDRLYIPVLETADKIQAERNNETLLEIFLRERCYYHPGEAITILDFHTEFQKWLDPNERYEWTKNKISKCMPSEYIKGRLKDAKWAYGNLSFSPPLPEAAQPKYIVKADKLFLENV